MAQYLKINIIYIYIYIHIYYDSTSKIQHFSVLWLVLKLVTTTKAMHGNESSSSQSTVRTHGEISQTKVIVPIREYNGQQTTGSNYNGIKND